MAATRKKAKSNDIELDKMSKVDLERLKIQADIHVADIEYRKVQLEVEQLERDLRADKSKLTSSRVYTFTGAVDDNRYQHVVHTLSAWAAESSAEPITVVINSPGGYVISGLAIYDFLRGLSLRGTPIHTVGIGEVASMGGVLLQAGDVRRVSPRAWLLIHEVSSVAYGKMSEIDDEVKFSKRLQDQCLEILASRSTMTKAAIAKKWKKKDWWLAPDEAVERGFADEVTEAVLGG